MFPLMHVGSANGTPTQHVCALEQVCLPQVWTGQAASFQPHAVPSSTHSKPTVDPSAQRSSNAGTGPVHAPGLPQSRFGVGVGGTGTGVGPGGHARSSQ